MRTFGGPHGNTYTATLDLKTLAVSELDVTNTHHDMFCPGAYAVCAGAGNSRLCEQEPSSPRLYTTYMPSIDHCMAACLLLKEHSHHGPGDQFHGMMR